MIRASIFAIARWVSAWALWLIPPAERDWARAMQGELDAIEQPGARLGWAVGGLGAALRIRVRTAAVGFDLLCAALLVLLTIFDWSSPDPVPTLILMAAFAASLAHARPEAAGPLGLLFGLWLFLAHLFADWSVELRPSYQSLPLSARELVEIGWMSAIALPAAWLGARLPGRARIS